ncbi:hypothetical protein JG688_00012974 [Phytophthora aleatoria]|uniref:Uncharacterized protein n=1 Tax=Phytophthora aleatoria TaxID=2496075 RepID=A0A8J5IN34_9STRA|nr:hypothetical protein JG688_00012974 [Phytophthora aleatoria]
MAQISDSSSDTAAQLTSLNAEEQAGEEDVDVHGIPISIKHYNQNQFTWVWNYLHKLCVPLPDPLDSSSPFTHICLVCADEALNSSDPIVSVLKIGGSYKEEAEITHRIKAHDANSTTEYVADDNVAAEEKQTPKKQRTLEPSIAMSPDEVRVCSSRWIVSSGLSYTII